MRQLAAASVLRAPPSCSVNGVEDRLHHAIERGARLFYSCVPVSAFSSSWPNGVPVQIHGMDADPIFVGESDIGAARALVEEAEDAELFL